MRNVSHRAVENIKTHILHSITFFFFENRTVYETTRKILVEPGRSRMKRY